MIRHVMSDGKEVKSIEGKVVPKEASVMILRMVKRDENRTVKEK